MNPKRVYLVFQRYKFKSKSQLGWAGSIMANGCIWYFKGTNSKANHNAARYIGYFLLGVFGISKVQIQKQITTFSSLI